MSTSWQEAQKQGAFVEEIRKGRPAPGKTQLSLERYRTWRITGGQYRNGDAPLSDVEMLCSIVDTLLQRIEALESR